EVFRLRPLRLNSDELSSKRGQYSPALFLKPGHIKALAPFSRTLGHLEGLTMIRVQAPCRLHIGLLNAGAMGPWPNIDGEPLIPGRRFGGVGMMISEPAITVSIEPHSKWSAQGPMSEKALAAAREYMKSVPEMSPQRIHVETSALPHIGLGTGTQLALAVAKALAVACGHNDWDSVELARRAGRGPRSGVGVHGFQHGGFIVEGGKHDQSQLSPLLAHCDVPEGWRVVLALPQS